MCFMLSHTSRSVVSATRINIAQPGLRSGFPNLFICKQLRELLPR